MPTFREDLHLGHKVTFVDTDDLADHSITAEKMAPGAVSTDALQDGCVTEPKLSDDAVSTRTIQDGAVTEPKLDDEAVSHRTIQPEAVHGDNIKPGSIGNEHLKDDVVGTRNIINKSVTPEKRSDDFDGKVVLPYVTPIDEKYEGITQELYSMIASLQVGGIALSQKFGYREDIGISQKTLTKAIGRIWEELGTITGKTYMDYTLTVEPTQIWAEGPKSVTVIADCSDAISDFDNIKVYVNGVLKAESHDITRYQTTVEITQDSIIRVEGVIMGKTITKSEQVKKAVPFFMGSGMNYQEVMVPENLKELVGTLEGDYDVTIKHNGDYMFIIIPISHKDEFRRADMNGLGLKIEIPMQATAYDDYVVYKSLNTYKAGTYNIDIDINS